MSSDRQHLDKNLMKKKLSVMDEFVKEDDKDMDYKCFCLWLQ